MTLGEFFIHYDGTKEQFIANNGATTYADSMVFISGGTSGNTCIFAQGMYFGNFAELLSAINYVKGVTVGGQSYNAAAGGGYVAFEATDPSTVAVNAGSNGVKIGLTEAFVNKVNSTATNLGSKGDAADKDGSAFARIANLAALVSDLTGGSTDSIEGQITAAINALREEIVGNNSQYDAETLADINAALDGLKTNVGQMLVAKVNGKALFDGYDGEDVVLAGGDIKVGGTSSINESTVEAALASHQSAIDTLNGTGDGSVSKQVADAIAGVVNSAPEDFDTLKEIADYIASDKTNATQINNDLSAIKNYSVNGKKFSAAEGGAVTLTDSNITFDSPDGATDYPFVGAGNVHEALIGLGIAAKDLNTNKQDKIADLETIRSGAQAGATAIQTVNGTSAQFITASTSSKAVTVGATIKTVASATSTSKGLAEAYDVQQYIDQMFTFKKVTA